MSKGHLCLSPIHVSLYEFIVAFKQRHDGVSPSTLEIGKACGINSTSEVRRHLNRLVLFGMIVMDYGKGKSRIIEVPGARWTPPLNGDFYSSPLREGDRVRRVSSSSPSK
jgi:SOS-response transcriptional repressor LexA